MHSEPRPSTPIAAAIHPDPYPYYAELVATQPLYRDESIGAWVASSAEAVTAVLSSEYCKVRPSNELVPLALVGSRAGEIFRRLIRMNDGAGHCPLNRAVAQTLAAVIAEIPKQSSMWSHTLLERLNVIRDRTDVTKFGFELSGHVLGSMLGIADGHLKQASEWMSEFVRCVFGATNADEIDRGKQAAENLWVLAQDILESSGGGGLLHSLLHAAESVGRIDRDSVISNGIGFLSQAYEATAGLIGNTSLLLSRREDVLTAVRAERTFIEPLLLEVLRFDPPAHSTRRFVSADTKVCGLEMRTGEMILVLLAAANRDPSINVNPERFELRRPNRRFFNFGVGIHACPGEAIALSIAKAGVAELLDSALNFAALQAHFTYRVSANTRIPLFAN